MISSPFLLCFGGVRDIENRILRTPLDPEQTFSDDPLRMMRAIRFSVQLDMQIDSKCKNTIKNIADRISIVSFERISSELNKMILAKEPSRAFYLLDEHDINGANLITMQQAYLDAYVVITNGADFAKIDKSDMYIFVECIYIAFTQILMLNLLIAFSILSKP